MTLIFYNNIFKEGFIYLKWKNINDSYSKDLINGKVININNDFLTSNNIRQSNKNIRNIIVNNISPTVNVLIHSEEKSIRKKRKYSNQKRVNSINVK